MISLQEYAVTQTQLILIYINTEQKRRNYLLQSIGIQKCYNASTSLKFFYLFSIANSFPEFQLNHIVSACTNKSVIFVKFLEQQQCVASQLKTQNSANSSNLSKHIMQLQIHNNLKTAMPCTSIMCHYLIYLHRAP